MGRYSGVIALVTGGASGIGKSTVERLIVEGASVVVADLYPAKSEGVLREIAAKGVDIRDSFALGLDVTDGQAVEAAFANVKARFGSIGLLVNSAGIREIIAPLDLPISEWNRVLDINLTGSFMMAQAFGRQIVAAGTSGAIVNIASTAGLVASRNRAAYVASKHGVVGLTKQLAYDLGPKGIRVNAVAPAVIRTPMTESYFDDPQRIAEVLKNYPLGRVGRPEDVASAVAFLGSHDAAFISGVVLPVDGEYSRKALRRPSGCLTVFTRGV
ncbi:SDR family oxidoreductase [Ochrobactrum haematophilum]|uniref:SDR family oxidoreductase n=1 Tax=Brucella haematophila TaxID=419474 RepID=A0ABX1DS10_9HYPH|nr:SDR family oxidoreductase [Brucella haematophila]